MQTSNWTAYTSAKARNNKKNSGLFIYLFRYPDGDPDHFQEDPNSSVSVIKHTNKQIVIKIISPWQRK